MSAAPSGHYSGAGLSSEQSSSGLHSGQFAGVPAPATDENSRRRRAALIALIALLVLVVVFLATRLMTRERDPITAVPMGTIPSTAPLGPDGQAVVVPSRGPVGGELVGSTTSAGTGAGDTETSPTVDGVAPTPTPRVATGVPDPAPRVETPRESSRGGSPRRRPRDPAPPATSATTPATTSASADPAPAPAEAFGFFSLDTVPWTEVSVDGRALGTTPLVRVRLPVGRHTLVLRNPEQALTERYSIEITAGETTTRRLGLR